MPQTNCLPDLLDIRDDDDFVDGAPRHVPASVVADDVRIYSRTRCPACGRRMRATPQHNPVRDSYRIRLVCSCGATGVA